KDVFSGCSNLKSISMPEGLTIIGENAFMGCTGLTNISFPEGVTSIGPGTFYSCTGLREISFPESLVSISDWAFQNCSSLKGITFNSAAVKIYDSQYVIPAGTKITGYANSGAERYARKYGRTFEAKPIEVIINGNAIVFDQPPVIIGGRTLVPLRGIFEALGAQVNWDGEKQTITAVKDTATVTVKIGSKQAIINGEEKSLDVPAQIINNRTMVPVRFISESLGAKVDWNDNLQRVIISQ
ncbi:MAG TPA: leucine-rich repeat protein, partial [Clostridia bacterium]|nr:leucine-rich repeat protein [Clostridia bacterium]